MHVNYECYLWLVKNKSKLITVALSVNSQDGHVCISRSQEHYLHLGTMD